MYDIIVISTHCLKEKPLACMSFPTGVILPVTHFVFVQDLSNLALCSRVNHLAYNSSCGIDSNGTRICSNSNSLTEISLMSSKCGQPIGAGWGNNSSGRDKIRGNKHQPYCPWQGRLGWKRGMDASPKIRQTNK